MLFATTYVQDCTVIINSEIDYLNESYSNKQLIKDELELIQAADDHTAETELKLKRRLQQLELENFDLKSVCDKLRSKINRQKQIEIPIRKKMNLLKTERNQLIKQRTLLLNDQEAAITALKVIPD